MRSRDDVGVMRALKMVIFAYSVRLREWRNFLIRFKLLIYLVCL